MDARDENLQSAQTHMSNKSDNPFHNLGQDVSEEQLQTWQQMSHQVRGLVQMSESDDEDEPVIDDSLLVTSVTAESLGFTVPVSVDPTPGPSGTAPTTDKAGATIHTFPASMELTLQYLSGKISFLEFSEQMERENSSQLPVPGTETGAEDAQGADEAMDVDEGSKDEPDKEQSKRQKHPRKRKPHKRRRRKWDLPNHLGNMMGEVNMIFAQGNHEEAIKQCLEIIRLAPNANKPFQTLGMIYEDMGDMQKALQYSLIAAYLAPYDSEEWARLADLCLEQNDIGQAIKCYSQAITANGENKVDCLWERSRLYESMKEHRKALDGYQMLLPLLSKSDTERYLKLAWGITRTYYEQGEKGRAIDTMTKAFTDHPDHITSEDVNLLLELLIQEKKYLQCLMIFVKHCGISFTFPGEKQWSNEHSQSLDDIKDDVPKRCDVPEMLPIDLRIKLAVCMIHMRYIKLIQMVVEPLFEEDIEGMGDLYLDVAEAYMDKGYHKQAEPLLRMLVNTQNYHLAAVWLRYGECLHNLGDLQGSVEAYTRVVELAPSHIGARMSLSAIQQQMGKHDEALELLQHDDGEQRKLSKEEQQMLLQKCHLLHAHGKLDEFLETAKQLLFHEWREIEAENMSYLQAIRTYKHRKDSLRNHFQFKGKDTKLVVGLTSSKKSSLAISYEDLWDIFTLLGKSLLEKERYTEFEEVTLLGMLCPIFSQEDTLLSDFEWFILNAAIISKNPQRAYAFGRQAVLENLESPQAWNMFMQVIMVCNDQRHNRFCLRKMMTEPNNIMLGIMNGHNSMASGTYKHSLGEYANVFRRIPTDPMVSLCIGLDFIHCASQRFAAKRQYLITQGVAFLNNYIELRGECQETYYNLARALHQINLLYAAIHYYKKALGFPPCVGEKSGMFDLSMEIAYNLALIYQNSGATDYARYLLYKYCVI
ncbi:general transcription factor 3C polypeptide 3-like [Mercenaria mercenaria]|uniref:general transcription factor 3C polypeptide 3-like n=1 Tax=Mercenaria mercenaria TaxID=6596 RepID=UPI00234FA94B|nr:general transcription factor 3C polypeptide 3-like [Mercenaria mercenaria]